MVEWKSRTVDLGAHLEHVLLRAGETAENATIQNLKVIAFGASAAILGLALILAMPPHQDVARQAQMPDPQIVGSISSPPRVPTRTEWQDIRKPVEMIALQTPQLDRQGGVYRARRSSQGDREDSLVWASQSPQHADVEINLTRRATATQAPSLYIEMSRRQSERGVAVTRSGMPSLLSTKFGKFEVADMTFTDEQNRPLACLAFRSAAVQDIALSGWYCAAQGAAVERPEVACFVDRLSLLKAGEDQKLRNFFTEAEKRRQPCPTTRVSTGRKPTWLDSDGKAPSIRGEITGSIPARR